MAAALAVLIGEPQGARTFSASGKACRSDGCSHLGEPPGIVCGMPDREFRYMHNVQTGRWDVIWHQPDGTETVVREYASSSEAIQHVAYANGQRPKSPRS